MDFKQLESYISCVKYKSLTIASEKIGIAQPTISIHLKNLEEELKTKLINRSAKYFEVTPKGKEFYAFAQNVLKEKSDLLHSWGEEETNTVNLGVSTIYSTYFLPEILLKYSEINDNTYFSIEQKDSKQIINGVKNGVYELGLVGMSVENENLMFDEFFEDTMVLVTPNQEKYSLLKEKNENALVELLKSPIILREDGSGSGKSVSVLLEKMGIKESKLHLVAKMDNIETIKNLVIGGLGVTIISERVVKDCVSKGELLQFDLPPKYSKRSLYIVHQKDCILKDSANDFISFLKKFYS